jgi:UDP-N-acetylmuramate--alanine ligase
MHIYFVGIGGSGLSPLAQLALDCGYEVSGSDLSHSHGTDAVEKRGVSVGYLQDGSNIRRIHNEKQIDFVVYTAACKPDHAEIQFAHEQGIRIGKRHEFINKILADKNLKMIAIAGTHGKTTTTAMTVWAFQKLGIPCSYLIGTNISFGPAALYQEGSKYFIYEDDEFDRNFLNFYPEITAVTSIDYDHPDTYPTKKDYFDGFSQALEQTQKRVFCWKDNKKNLSISNEKLNIFTILSKENLAINNIEVAGFHNRTNGYLVVQMLNYLFKIEESHASKILSTFPGTQRRFEKISDGIYSDYAHHPTEIQATLQLAGEINGQVVVVYQPHQNLRQIEVKADYRGCFRGASKIYWLDTYLSREPEGVEILKKAELGGYVEGVEVVYYELNDELKETIARERSKGNLVIGMGAGSIDGWLRENFA